MINNNAKDLGDALVRPGLRALVPYESARRIGGSGEVWLNANENPYPRELTISAERWHRYPDFQPPTVVEGYARYAGVAPEQLLISRGADEAIELLIRTFCEPGVDKVIYCPPTYGMYNISSKTNLVALTEVPLDSDFQPDVAAIVAAAVVTTAIVATTAWGAATLAWAKTAAVIILPAALGAAYQLLAQHKAGGTVFQIAVGIIGVI